MPQDRYNFDKQLNKERGLEAVKLNPRWYDERMLSNEKDEKITARREARKAKYIKNTDVKVISPEDIAEGKKREKKKIKTSKAILIAIAFAFVIAFVANAGIKLTNLQLEKKAAEKELAALNQKVEQLSDELKELDSVEYIENAARSELHMIRKGEVMYIVESGEEEVPDEGSAK